jgi:hypothetical protein
MRLLKATEQLKNLLDGFVYNHNAVKFFKDSNDNWVLPEAVKILPHIQPYLSQMELVESEIDQNLTELARMKEKVKFRASELAYPGSNFKDYRAIDFLIEIPNLIPVKEYDPVSGLQIKEVWYEELDAEGNPINDVIKVEDYVHNLAEDSKIPAARTVLSTFENIKFKATNTEDIHITDVDGNVIQSVTFTDGYPDDPSFWRVRKRYFNTPKQRREAGIKRRQNLVNEVEEYLYGELMSVYTDVEIIKMLTELLSTHNQAIDVYLKSGAESEGDIYSSIQTDTREWLTQEMKDKVVTKTERIMIIEVKTGDIAIIRRHLTPNPASWSGVGVRFFTGCRWNHCLDFIWLDDILYVSEAVGSGVILVPYEVWRKKYPHTLKVIRLDKEPPADQRHRILSTVGLPYDYTSLLRHQPVRQLARMFEKEHWTGRTDLTKGTPEVLLQ